MGFPESKVEASVVYTATHTVSIGTVTAATVLVTAPAADEYDLQVEVQASNTLSLWTLSEAPNASGGTAITPLNHNRDSALTLGATVAHTATYVSSGTVMENHSAAAGMQGLSGWWKLDAGDLYLVRCVAANAGTTVNVNARFVKRDT
jgi:hypothetical protein